MSTDVGRGQDDVRFTDSDVETLHKRGTTASSTALRKCYTHARKKAFATFVTRRRVAGLGVWQCCGHTFQDQVAIHRHVAVAHGSHIHTQAEAELERPLMGDDEPPQTEARQHADVSRWIPHVGDQDLVGGPGEVLLFYCYCPLEDPQLISRWQRELCETLRLTGKVRVGTEGINGTVGGTRTATALYVNAMLTHPVFNTMQREDFKSSVGGADAFTELRVGVYKEIVPMGVDPGTLSYRLAGVHLEPEEFHGKVETFLSGNEPDTMLLDCRNFYESKIGQFSKCLAPDIRKFSYFPDYVDKNLELFRDKKVLMYCTGGIRCERGSAYLRSKEVCKAVYQLKGGIHKYLERFPEGFYRGKLFVFDERYALSYNNDVISACRYCGSPWDSYQLCSSSSCCQLVLSCPTCRNRGLTACCPACHAQTGLREECECTQGRARIPLDVPHATTTSATTKLSADTGSRGSVPAESMQAFYK